MSQHVLKSLRAWSSAYETGRHSQRVCDWQVQKRPFADAEQTDAGTRADTDQMPLIDLGWKPAPPSSKPENVIPCRVVELDDGPEAVCWMVAGGQEIPRVSFLAWVLRQKGLRVGSRFNWIVRDPGHVRLADIDPDVPQSEDMTPAEKARLEALHDEFKRGLAEDGGNWPVYTGDGE